MGGGALFVWAHKVNPQCRKVISDINPGLISIYTSIRDDEKRFTDCIDSISDRYMPLSKPDRKKFYYDVRAKHAFDYSAMDQVTEAAHLYFLMRTCFNGIWQINQNTNGRFGTPSGLLNQKTSVYSKENVMLWHDALQGCEILCGDFQHTAKHIDADSFVYLDPPYRGCFTSYGQPFGDDRQEDVIEFFKMSSQKGAHTLLSNRDIGDRFFADRLRGYNIVKLDVTYTAGRRKKNADGTFSAKKASEILVHSA